MDAVTVYGMKASGNCFKVQLILEQTNRPYRWVEVNSAAGETRRPEFLAKNSNGKVPLLERLDARVPAESNAILCFLAEGSPLLPSDSQRRSDLPRLRERGYQALDVKQEQLSRQDFFVGSGYCVADIALCAYTHEAHLGGFDLAGYPCIRAWLARVVATPGFVPHRY